MITQENSEPNIHDMVAELTRAHRHREPYTHQDSNGTTWARHHESQVPSLVHQLLYASPSRGETGSGFTSRPTAHVEAVDTLMTIDDQASRWVKRLGHDDPGDTFVVVSRAKPQTGPACATCTHPSCAAIRRGGLIERDRIHGSGTIACITLLHGLQASAPRCPRAKPKRDLKAAVITYCCTAHHIEADIRRWRFQARIVSGWDKAPFKPDNTCPVCEQRGGLRVRLLDRTAMCIECHETWESATIGILGEHIRAENGEGLTEPQPAHSTETRHAS